LEGKDEKRNSDIVDIVKLNQYVEKNYSGEKIVIVEGHLSHLLKSVDILIVLRLHPSYLKKHLENKGWGQEKIKENLEAEMLDVILCEAVDTHSSDKIVELNVTDKSIDESASTIIDLVENGFKNMQKYKIGNIDWSEEILKDF
jgi:adenylate kinase